MSNKLSQIDKCTSKHRALNWTSTHMKVQNEVDQDKLKAKLKMLAIANGMAQAKAQARAQA